MTDYSDLFNQHETDDLIRELNGNILWRYEPMNPDDTRPPVSSTAPFRAAERLKVMRWQPIKTAPKDGTLILIALFNNNGSYWVQDIVSWNEYRNEWDSAGYDWDNSEDTKINHWMPLPPPPKKETK